MTKLVICGQAPSRVGDGRPFSGPSGKRLAALLKLGDYEALAAQVTLVNLLEAPEDKRSDRGDHFDVVAARAGARRLNLQWNDDPEDIVVLACGHLVFRCLTGKRVDFFRGIRRPGVEIWAFPHPSGASAFWNFPENRKRAHRFLKRLLKQRAILMAR